MIKHDESAERAKWVEARQAVMRICAAARPQELAAIVERLAPTEAVMDLRRAEKGLAMLRGRIGGEGAPFNLGEATVTRAAIQLADGTQGFAYHLGRDARKARNAAILDALWQRDASQAAVGNALIAISTRLTDETRQKAERTAATRVNFFTMTRGDD